MQAKIYISPFAQPSLVVRSTFARPSLNLRSIVLSNCQYLFRAAKVRRIIEICKQKSVLGAWMAYFGAIMLHNSFFLRIFAA